MALPSSYLTTVKNLEAIFSAIQGAQAPEKFTQAFLESLEFKGTADRLIIGVLKALGFLDDSGRPKDRYFRYLDQTQGKKVLAEALRDAYQDLFRINVKADLLGKQDVINKFKTLGQGQFSDSVLDKMAMTFTSLVKLADFETTLSPQPTVKEKVSGGDEGQKQAEPAQPGNLRMAGLVYNIQIVLPESRDPAVYDALFQSLRRHLT